MTKIAGKAKQKLRKKELGRQQKRFLSYKKELLSSIRKFDDPILKEKCSCVETLEEANRIKHKLSKVLFATKTGVGLAACQIGIIKQVVIIRPDLQKKSSFFLVNPEIISHSEERITGNEGCLSYPGVFTEVERYKWIEVKFLDEKFTPVTKKFIGKEGVIVAHEIDHLFGVCLIGDFWEQNKK